MRKHIRPSQRHFYSLAAGLLILTMTAALNAGAVTVSAVDGNGAAITGFRWLAEEDATYNVVPGVPDPLTLAVRFHTSYMPVVSTGRATGSSANIPLAPDKRYFISVLPDSGYTNSGTSVDIGQTAATVICQSLPLPTAQLSVFVFEDNSPINNAPDLPGEQPLAGFKVALYEAGGTYGMSGGQMMMDFFGNPLGTEYDSAGNPTVMGNGVFTTDASGEVVIKNLAQGKYTIQVVPPSGTEWRQTSTIEGTPGVDAWIKPNEPRFFVEFGPPGWHVFIGFVRHFNDTSVLSGGGTISGQVVNLHTSRPPDYRFFAGEPVRLAWVGLNEMSVGNGRGVYTAPCNADGTFSIPNVPAGNYQIVFWDEPLDLVWASKAIIMPGGDLNLGAVPVFSWFARMRNEVFDDRNENGFPDPGEAGISNVNMNLRFRDGSIYQSFPTDPTGVVEFHEVFPFFNWLIQEVDYTRFKPTGATIAVDNGGEVLPHQGWAYPSFGVLTPQPQFDLDGVTPLINPNTGNNLSRTETGPGVLLEGFQAFLGTTNAIAWGKSDYVRIDIDNNPKGNFPGTEDTDWNGNGEFDGGNGGISGIVHYATTRAEDDPRFAAAENWEPGIPRVQVALYADYNNDSRIDDLNKDGGPTRADVDNWPFNWKNPPYQKGDEDTVDWDSDGVFDAGDAMNIVTTDSWDDSPPSGAQGPPFISHGVPTDAYDGLRNFNQVRPAVFDGGYAFFGGWLRNAEGTLQLDSEGSPIEAPGLADGYYIVGSDVPPGYQHQQEEDKNVDFGDTYVPGQKSGLLELYPPCVGDLHPVPPYLALFEDQQIPCANAGAMVHAPDLKQVELTSKQNPPCDFFMFTEVPVAGHIVGMILNDLANEFDPNAPTFGEKHAPAWMPISIRDHTGREVSRVYSDEWGTYNALVPSTYSINPPFPSGVSPKMMTVVLNSPGPIIDTRAGSATYGQYITDPFFDRRYSQFSYTFQYNPGKTTYLDTPVLPISAFVGPGQFELDCDFPNGTPVIWSVENGPYVTGPGQTLTVISAGPTEVPNPEWIQNGAAAKTIVRDYGFGAAAGTITLNGVALTGVIWTDGSIKGTVPPGTATGELVIKRANGIETPVGITVTVGPISGTVRQVHPSTQPGATPIQNAIDTANPGDLILIAPGQYDELVIMWKPVQLQGYGAYSTFINAVKTPSEKLQAWRTKVQSLIVNASVDLLPSQEVDFTDLEPITLNTEEGPGILVIARNVAPSGGGFGANPNARIDGLTVTGADHGGGILVNGYAHYLEISNNHVTGNQGFFGGGIRLGHPDLTIEIADGLQYDNCHNDHVKIHHNHIDENGSLGGVGGGISIHTGCDFYEVTQNYICGNFTVGSGAGIGHQGLSRNGVIGHNVILFNQTFDQGTNPSGGGIYIAGGAPLGGGLTPGSGSVIVTGNQIQGNQAGAGDGGGIRVESVNGQDVAAAPGDPSRWFTIDIVNNMIVNNMAGLAAGGISMQDTAVIHIVNNTVAHNDSTATAGLAFAPGNPNQSTPQPAGIVSHAHSTALMAAIGTGTGREFAEFANPLLVNNIIWRNRSFYFALKPGQTPPYGMMPEPTSPSVYADLAVLGTATPAKLDPRNGLLTYLAGYDSSNRSGTPGFAHPYLNGSPGQTLIMPESTTAFAAAAAFDEGGNFIDLHFGPLTRNNPRTGIPYGDYHIKQPSPARDIGALDVLSYIPRVTKDFDRENRPNGGLDAGADEWYATGVTNSAPLAANDSFTIRSFIIGAQFISAPGVLANDSDADGNPLRADLVSGPTNGLLSLNANGSFIYISLFFVGTDSFTYTASDGTSVSNVVTVTLHLITGGNGRPVAVNDTYATLMDTPLVVPPKGVLTNDSDPNGDSIIARLFSNVRNGTLALRGDGSFRYTPRAGFAGDDSFQYQAYDGTSTRATVTIHVTPPVVEENVAPAPSATAITTTTDLAAVTRVIPSDPNTGDVHTYEITTPSINGTATITPTGIVVYRANAAFVGTDSLIVTVTDQGGLSGAVTINVTVTEMAGMQPYNGLIQRGGPDDQFIHLAAGDGFVRMADGKVLYCFGFGDMTDVADEHVMMEGMLSAEFPGPTIIAKEGRKLYLNLTNVGMAMRPDLFDEHTVHWHGFPQASSVFDGEPEASISTKMGSTLTYYYEPVEPGTYMYHCHREATEHMQMGMLANLYVTPKQDGTPFTYKGKQYTKFVYNDGDGSTGYDVGYPIQIGSFDPNFHELHIDIQPLPMALMKDLYPMLNGRGYPDTIDPGVLTPPEENGGKASQKISSLITAQRGDRVLLRVSNLNVTRLYTLACLGIPMEVVGEDARILRSPTGEDLSYKTNSVTLGGGESCDVMLNTADVLPGTYVLYTTNLNYLSNNTEDFGGMMTEIVVSE